MSKVLIATGITTHLVAPALARALVAMGKARYVDETPTDNTGITPASAPQAPGQVPQPHPDAKNAATGPLGALPADPQPDTAPAAADQEPAKAPAADTPADNVGKSEAPATVGSDAPAAPAKAGKARRR